MNKERASGYSQSASLRGFTPNNCLLLFAIEAGDLLDSVKLGNYLNPDNFKFQEALNSDIYVDKTGLIRYTIYENGSEENELRR